MGTQWWLTSLSFSKRIVTCVGAEGSKEKIAVNG
jgi:hypothetical protein